MTNKISVALCTYNGEHYIKEQLLSILQQTIKPDEIIVCDDNSKDNTVKVINQVLSGAGVSYKIYVNESNKGVVNNFQYAIELCRGKIIFTSDQDDIWNSRKIEKILNEFNQNNNCIMVFTDAELVDQNREKIGINLWETLNFKKRMVIDQNYYSVLLNRCIVTGATMAFKRELFDKIKPFPKYWIHDGWLAINAPLYGMVSAVDIPLIEYRQHSSNVIGANTNKRIIPRIKRYFQNIKTLDDIRNQRFFRLELYN